MGAKRTLALNGALTNRQHHWSWISGESRGVVTPLAGVSICCFTTSWLYQQTAWLKGATLKNRAAPKDLSRVGRSPHKFILLFLKYFIL
jgi:hypothetical protein